MKPVAVFQHCHNVQPGHFASFLDAHQIPWQLIAVDRGDPVPASIDAFSGLCFMGGPMSVNDSLPWIPQELALIRQAIAADMPVIGHCLGGQLMSLALGGEVTRNPVKEIGWGAVQATDTSAARHWLGTTQAFDAYQWHGETFSLPEGAVRILGGEYCANQAYVLGPGDGIHLGMQFHIEMTEALIHDWNTDWADECDVNKALPSVQTTALQLSEMPRALPVMRGVAEQLYRRWVQALRT
ncbi:type 1 glutamine amidotransferase [Uliginosibacterium sp. H3]|uniref:Type 1 glutamine amidotransferase n=1 Tax=Uliginosibacterium silvisoli TaxID=3114758 RepID=A0ABU6K3X2_9RHOO|nr:type 1 glutamine amidotransferase [Uliginosibacterium sp. H3]